MDASELMRSHFPTEQKPPLQILVQFDRESGRYEVTFEDDDASRWKVTPNEHRAAQRGAAPELRLTRR